MAVDQQQESGKQEMRESGGGETPPLQKIYCSHGSVTARLIETRLHREIQSHAAKTAPLFLNLCRKALVQAVNFDQRDAGGAVHTSNNGCVVAGQERPDDNRLGSVRGLQAGSDDFITLITLPVVVGLNDAPLIVKKR